MREILRLAGKRVIYDAHEDLPADLLTSGLISDFDDRIERAPVAQLERLNGRVEVQIDALLEGFQMVDAVHRDSAREDPEDTRHAKRLYKGVQARPEQSPS